MTQRAESDGIAIRPSSPEDASAGSLVRDATRIINDAYRWSEAEQWIGDKERTSADEVRTLMADGGFLLAFSGTGLCGIVAVQECGPGVAAFGMLATDRTGLRQGIGRRLVDAAEAWARERHCNEMEIEIVHGDPPNAHKRLLHEWYTRLGYVKQATWPIAARIPELAPLQKQTVVSSVYRKRLK